MRQQFLGFLAVGLAVVGFGGVARAQEAYPGSKPLKEHEVLKHDAGTWDGAIKIYSDPNADPIQSKGVETNELLPGGLWVISRFDGDFAGQPFQGRGQTGYDPAKKKYVMSWVDSMVPTMTLMEGTYDEAKHTMTFLGDMPGPDGKPTKTKIVSTFKGKDEKAFEMSVANPAGEGWVKMMEISYKRRSGSENK